MNLSLVDISPVPEGGTQTDALRNTLDLAKDADRLGFARYWIAEHHRVANMQASFAPEALIPAVAAVTKRIRVGSGAVLLNHYSPFKVAEAFRQLHATFPSRIYLGLGRATGGAALDYGQQVAEVLGWLWRGFPKEHPFAAQYPLMPSVEPGPSVWMLGSSTSSAQAAGQLGIPYVYASFINPFQAVEALEVYRMSFEPAGHEGSPAEPHAMLAINAVTADEGREAARLAMTFEGLLYRLQRGIKVEKLPTPGEAAAKMGRRPQPTRIEDRWRTWALSGTPERVRNTIETMVEESGAEEVMIYDIIPDSEARRRSHELFAEAFRLAPAARVSI